MVIFNVSGLLIFVAACIPWAVIPEVGYSWAYAASGLMAFSIDVGRRLKVTEPLLTCLFHPGAGGHIFFIPVWVGGTWPLAVGVIMLLSAPVQAMESDVRSVFSSEASGNTEEAVRLRLALNKIDKRECWHARVAEYADKTMVILFRDYAGDSVDSTLLEEVVYSIIPSRPLSWGLIQATNRAFRFRWERPRDRSKIRPGLTEEYGDLDNPLPWLQALTVAMAFYVMVVAFVQIRRPVLPHI